MSITSLLSAKTGGLTVEAEIGLDAQRTGVVDKLVRAELVRLGR